MSFDIDVSQVNRLAADLRSVDIKRAVAIVDPIVKKAAQNVKDEMAADAKGSRHFGYLAGAISYDRRYSLGAVGYEVGPDKDRRGGAIGNIAYFGGVHGGGGTLDIDKPLRSETPKLLDALGDALGDVL